MLGVIRSLPFFVLVLGVAAAAMLVPAIHAALTNDHHTARVFFYSAVMSGFIIAMVSLAISAQKIRRRVRSHLITMVATFVCVPAVLAVPFAETLQTTTFFNAYFEMVSSLTTTGATLFTPDRLPPSLHLWRATVGWLGGLFVWITAVAILAPLNLGGFEVRGVSGEIGHGEASPTPITRVADTSERLERFAMRLFPIYTSLTVILWALLYVAGDTPLVALCHAMSTLATSGISPLDLSSPKPSGYAGEMLIFLFLIFALSRLTFASDDRADGWYSLRKDPELRLGLLLVVVIPTFLFVRHWIGAIEMEEAQDLTIVIKTLWGGLYTTMSFLTTTGFESIAWIATQSWSGLETPGLILLGLAMFGGGVATTAGGVKLLRVYALYQHGMREMEKLVHPHSVGGAGQSARRLRRQGAYVAWIFFMLFALSISAVMTAFAAAGVPFEDTIVLAIASLTTTGPLVDFAGGAPVDLAMESTWVRSIFIGAMVVGRLETLAIIALLNPDFWRG